MNTIKNPGALLFTPIKLGFMDAHPLQTLDFIVFHPFPFWTFRGLTLRYTWLDGLNLHFSWELSSHVADDRRLI
jgi:hypothetical protein